MRFPRLGGQGGDVADGARAWALGRAEGLANQIGEVEVLAALALGNLDEHTGYIIMVIYFIVNTIMTLLLATF